MPAPHRAAVTEAAASAFLSGFRVAMLVSAVLAVVAAVVNWRLLRPVAASAPDHVDAAVASEA